MKRPLFKYIPAHFGRIFNFTGFVFLSFLPLFAGSIVSGTVRDESGTAVPDVNIVVAGTALGTVTDINGRFTLPRLPDGDYRIGFHHVCCEAAFADVVSGTADRIRLDIVISVKTIVMDPVTAVVSTEYAPQISLTARDISLSGSGTVQEVLQKVPGVIVESISGGRSRVSIRGTDSKHTSVYLDGVLMNSPMDGSFDLGSIPSEIIEKIEIYKSGDNTITSRSVGGIISITTRKNSGKNEIFASYGNSVYLSDRDNFDPDRLNNHNYGAGFSKNIGRDQGILFSISGRKNENEWSYINAAKADEYRYINNPNTPRTHTNSYSYSDNIFVSYNFASENIEGSAGANYSIHEYGLPGWYDQPYYDAFSEKSELRLSGYAACKIGCMQHRFDSSFNLRKEGTKIEEVNPIYYTDTQNRFENLKIKYETKYTPGGFMIRAGSEYFTESAESELLSGSRNSRNIVSLFTRSEYKKEFNGLVSLNTWGGIRRDFISDSDFGKCLLSASLAPSLQTERCGMIFSYSYDQAYNLPSFSDLFWAENLFSSGNSDLKPEYSVQHEISFTSVFHAGVFTFRPVYTYYDKELDDLIVWIKLNNGKYSPQNFKRGSIRGHEISLDSEISDIFGIKAEYNLMDARQFTDNTVTNDKFIIYKPVETLSLMLSGYHAGYHAQIRMKYNGKMYINESNSIDIYPFTLYGVGLSRSVMYGNAEIVLSAGCENITDVQYQVIYGYPMPGRKIETGIKIKF